MYKGNVLFVNKDSKTVGQKRSHQEARAINEHVNGTYARWQRDQKVKTNRHSSGKQPSSRHSDEIDNPSSTGIEDEEDEYNSTPPSRSSRHSTEGPNPGSRHNTPTIGSPSMRRSPTAQPSNGGMSSEDVAAVKFATEFHVHTLGFSDLPGLPNNQLWTKWWLNTRLDARRQETQLAMLAWAYSTMTFVHPSSARDRVVKGLEYRGAALQGLQRLMQSLKTPGDHAAALDCTLYLGCFEWQHGLINETIAHFKAAKSFLDALGGLKALPSQSQEAVLWILTNVSFTFSVRPLIKTCELGSNSRYGGEVESMCRMSLDDRRPNNTVDQLIGSRLSAMLEQMNDLLDDLGELAKCSSTTEKVKGFHSLYMYKLGLQLQLAHLWHDTLEAAPSKDRHRGSPTTSSSSSLRSTFTLLLRLFAKITTDNFTTMITWKSYFVPWHDKTLDRLRPVQADIMSTASNSSRPDREQKAKELILLWMLFTGACIEQRFLTTGARDAGQSDRTIFCSSQFTKLAGHMGYDRAGDVAADLAKYLVFSNSKQGQILKKLMQPLEHGSENGRRSEK